MPMSQEERQEIDELRETIRGIGATLKHLRQEKEELDRVKTGPNGEIDLEAWSKAEAVRGKIQATKAWRGEVQGRLNDLLRPFRARKVIPALQEHGATVTQLIEEVRTALPAESRATPHLQRALDEALTFEDEGTALGKLLDLFLFGEVRGAIQEVLGIDVSNGTGG